MQRKGGEEEEEEKERIFFSSPSLSSLSCSGSGCGEE